MHQEIEMKFKVESFDILSGEIYGPVIETDTYFQHPSENYLETDEWFRIRETYHYQDPGMKDYVITYKGKREGNCRQELEFWLKESTQELFEILKFKPLVVVQKRRSFYDHPEVSLVADEVKNLGKFIEIEILTDDGDVKKASAVIEAVAKELGLTNQITKGYAQMMLEMQNPGS